MRRECIKVEKCLMLKNNIVVHWGVRMIKSNFDNLSSCEIKIKNVNLCKMNNNCVKINL